MNKIFLAIWANVWDKYENIKNALNLLWEKIFNIKSSNIYKTKPFWETDQDNFLNLVISWETNLNPQELLIFVKNIEKEIWRIHRYKWWPREIDIDIIFYSQIIFDEENLKIPHIWIQNRDFVMIPFLDLEKSFIHPYLWETIEKLYSKLDKNLHTIIWKYDI